MEAVNFLRIDTVHSLLASDIGGICRVTRVGWIAAADLNAGIGLGPRASGNCGDLAFSHPPVAISASALSEQECVRSAVGNTGHAALAIFVNRGRISSRYEDVMSQNANVVGIARGNRARL